MTVVPRAARVPIVPNMGSNTLYPELQPYVYRSMQEVYPGPNGQCPVNNNQFPTALTVTKSTPEMDSDQSEKKCVNDKVVSEVPQKGLSFSDLQRERMVHENTQ